MLTETPVGTQVVRKHVLTVVKGKMNLIVENEKSVRFYTSLWDVARWLDLDLKDFDWHLSDIDGGWSGIPDPCWITGYGLVEKLQEYDYQFIWAVLSAFPKGTEPRLNPEPYADGNTSFWNGSPKKQLQGAIFEIVCWDSSATLFIGLPEELATNALKNIPGIKKLDGSVVDPI